MWTLEDYEEIEFDGVTTIKRSDGAFIPVDENNKDYKEYLALQE